MAAENRRSGAAALYRAYWLIVIDVLLHLGIKLAASLLRSRRLVDFLYRHLLPACIFPKWRVTDRSDRQLLMRHDLFRHLEMEVFVQRKHLEPALDFVVEVLRAADDGGYEVSPGVHERIRDLDMRDALEEIRGSYSQHYPVCVRRVMPDDTLISMASCHGIEEQDWVRDKSHHIHGAPAALSGGCPLSGLGHGAAFRRSSALGKVVPVRCRPGRGRISRTHRIQSDVRGVRSEGSLPQCILADDYMRMRNGIFYQYIQ